MLDETLRTGHYAKNQLFGKSALISWSHRRRFGFGLELVRRFHGKRLLDYGCGDGTLLAMLQTESRKPAFCVGAEIEPGVVLDCQHRFKALPGVTFCAVPELWSAAYEESFDTVVCTEVLEHVVELEEVVQRLKRLVAPGGCLIISVPVETGLPVLFKQTVRRIAGWRGVGDYKWTSKYTAPEMLASIFAGSRQHIERKPYRNADGSQSYDHKGFNWRYLRDLLQREFKLEHIAASPLPYLGSNFSSQMWFVAVKAPQIVNEC